MTPGSSTWLTKDEYDLILKTRKEKEHEEYKYLHLLEDILNKGYDQNDRTGVGTKTIHGAMVKYNIRNNVIPVITTRRTFIRGAFEEFQWMLKGETDASILQNKKINIWDGNTTEAFINKRGLKDIIPINNIGTLYGFQIRNWGGDWIQWRDNKIRTGVDQLQKLINGIQNDPNGRRHIISNYNVSQLDTGVLEPCHTLYAFNIDVEHKEIHSTLFMRSVDCGCGLVLNQLHISMFTHMLAKLLGYTAGDFVFMGNNVHIYKNHFNAVKEQIQRNPFPFPTFNIKKELNTIDDIINLNWDDVSIENYKHHPPIKFEMAI
jgi:thymidylate synthase